MTTSTPGTSRFVDLSPELYDAMAPCPWLALPRIGTHWDHAASRSNFDVGLADLLVTSGIALLDVEFWDAGDTTTRRRPACTRLLDAGILIVELLCRLGYLPTNGVRFSAPVVRIRQGAPFPVRAFAQVPA